MIDKIAYQSHITNVNPNTKLIFSIVPMMICLIIPSFSGNLFTILCMGYATISCSKISLKKYLKFLFVPLTFLLIGTVTIMISKYPLGTKMLLGITSKTGIYGMTVHSLLQGLYLALKALSAVSCMYFLSFNTKMTDIFYVLGKTKLPKIMISLMELIYRYIFVIMEEARKMEIAQDSRLGYHSFRAKFTSLGILISALFIRSYGRADRTYAALESRGYQGDLDSLTEEYMPFKKLYIYTILVCIIQISLVCIERNLIIIM